MRGVGLAQIVTSMCRDRARPSWSSPTLRTRDARSFARVLDVQRTVRARELEEIRHRLHRRLDEALDASNHLELLGRERAGDPVFEQLGVPGRGAQRILDVVRDSSQECRTRLRGVQHLGPLLIHQSCEDRIRRPDVITIRIAINAIGASTLGVRT